MNAYGPVDVGEEVATLHSHLTTALRRNDDARAMLAGIPQHPAAFLGSAVDDGGHGRPT